MFSVRSMSSSASLRRFVLPRFNSVRGGSVVSNRFSSVAEPQQESEEKRSFRDMVRKFFIQNIAPYHAEWEKSGVVSRECWRQAGSLGLLGMTAPAKFGGPELDFSWSSIVIEEQNLLGFTGPFFSLHSDIIMPYVIKYAQPSIQEKYLPKMVSGDCISAIAMTEPGAGSDLRALTTTAKIDGDEIVVSGQKTFISNGQLADFVIVVCRTELDGKFGTSLVLVDSDSPGFQRGPLLQKIGMKAQDTSTLFWDNVRVPKANVLGKWNSGLHCIMAELPQERLSIAIGAAYAARGGLNQTIEYTRNRKIFGQPVAALQHNRFKLADLHAQVVVAETFVRSCIEKHDRGELDGATASMAKMWCTNMQGKVLDECLQMHGGYGVMWDCPVGRAYVDARATRIYGGANEVMLELIARSLKL